MLYRKVALYIYWVIEKKYFSVFYQTNPDNFWLWIVRIKIYIVAGSKEHACNYTNESITGVFVIRSKTGPDSRKKFKIFFLKNVAISLDHYPKDFKFSGYEGLIRRKICPRQPKTKRICSGLQWVLISHLSHFQLIFDDEISV